MSADNLIVIMIVAGIFAYSIYKKKKKAKKNDPGNTPGITCGVPSGCMYGRSGSPGADRCIRGVSFVTVPADYDGTHTEPDAYAEHDLKWEMEVNHAIAALDADGMKAISVSTVPRGDRVTFVICY